MQLQHRLFRGGYHYHSLFLFFLGLPEASFCTPSEEELNMFTLLDCSLYFTRARATGTPIGQEPFTETPLHSHAQGRLHLPPNAQCRLQLIRSDTSLRMCSVRLGRAPTGLAMADTRRRLSKRIRRGAAIDMLRPNNRRNHAASTAHPICRDGMCRVGFQLCSKKDPERQNDPDRRRHTRLHNMRRHCRNDPLGLRTRPKENPPLAGCLGVRVCVRERAGMVCVCVFVCVCAGNPPKPLSNE
jgi:hypothetical protein